MAKDEPYREIVPPPALAAYVDRFWTRTTHDPSSDAHRVLPDGCFDLVVDLHAHEAQLVGPMTRAALVPGSAARIVSARFRPGAGARFAGVPLAALLDAHVDARDLAIDASKVLDALAEASTTRERVQILAAFVRERLAQTDPIDRTVRHAAQRLARDPSTSIDALTHTLGTSRQYLARLFARDVGVTPKLFARIARMQRVVLAIERGRRDWSRLATELGFSDQAHLIHDASELTGLTPARLAGEVSISPIASVFGGVEAAT